MIYHIYRLNFKTPVHFGIDRLDSRAGTISADTLFSALCGELSHDESKINELVELVRDGKLLLSDLFPFTGDTYFLPRPAREGSIEKEYSQKESTERKKLKKVSYISAENFDSFVKNQGFDVDAEISKLKKIGVRGQRTMSSSKDEKKQKTGDMLPYQVGIYTFRQDSGLYLIVGTDGQEAESLFNEAMKTLSYSGIGGKRSRGFGRFELSEKMECPARITDRIVTADAEHVMLLSCGMTSDKEELAQAMGEKDSTYTSYTLKKRSGYIRSYTYSDSFRRKTDYYSFARGSCFEKGFKGEIADVKDDLEIAGHSVYRYAMPIFMEVD